MKTVNELISQHFPNVKVDMFSCVNGHDIRFGGLFQCGYGDWLETTTHYTVRKMSPEVFEVYKSWNTPGTPLRVAADEWRKLNC